MKVLVLCHGNVNRSAAAHVVLAASPKLEVRSAGFLKANRKAAAKMRRAMKLRGYDLEAHRSSMCTVEDLEWADVVFVMDKRNEQEVLELLPVGCTRATTRLGSFCEPAAPIPDPCWLKESDPKFTAVVDSIVQACQRFIATLP